MGIFLWQLAELRRWDASSEGGTEDCGRCGDSAMGSSMDGCVPNLRRDGDEAMIGAPSGLRGDSLADGPLTRGDQAVWKGGGGGGGGGGGSEGRGAGVSDSVTALGLLPSASRSSVVVGGPLDASNSFDRMLAAGELCLEPDGPLLKVLYMGGKSWHISVMGESRGI